LLRKLKGSPWMVEMSCEEIHHYQKGTAHVDCKRFGTPSRILGEVGRPDDRRGVGIRTARVVWRGLRRAEVMKVDYLRNKGM
jgi:hypothetical protein